MAIQILYLNDSPLAAYGLQCLLETASQRTFQLTVVPLATLNSNDALLDLPAVMLIDIDSDPTGVLAFIARVRDESPNTKILILSRFEDTGIQDQAMLNGAHGVITRETPVKLILTAIDRVSAGELWIDHRATVRIVAASRRVSALMHDGTKKKATLTEREQQIVICFAQNSGDAGRVLAQKLHISESTLRNHLTTIYDKLEVRNNHGLLAYALKHGLDK